MSLIAQIHWRCCYALTTLTRQLRLRYTTLLLFGVCDVRSLVAICTGLVLLIGSLATPRIADAKRPNVVLIMTDNHGAWTLGCYGNKEVRTPNIDRMAKEGVLFTRAFASNPVCSPTRATCLTGLVPSQHGVHSFLGGGRLQTGPDARCTLDQFTSLPEVLRDEGYACGLVGKWHLGGNMTPQEGLDDYWITMPHGGTSTFYDAKIIRDGKLQTEPQYLTDLWTDHAVKFIGQQAKQRDKPFFLFLAYNGPYALSRLLLRDGKNRHAEYYADKPLDSFPRNKVHPWQLNNRDFINNPTSIRRVATEVSGVDDGVGEVFATLKKHGLDDDTIVIFVADQGWEGGHGGFFGMGDHTRPLTARDRMMQIPMIWRHPKSIAAGVRENKMIANYDLMPTLLGHLGIADKMPAAPKSPGEDLSSLLDTNRSQKPTLYQDDAIFYEFENLRCVRSETHKYIHRHPNGPHELYDLMDDPEEFVNLVAMPKHAETRDMLKARLDAFYKQHSLPKYDMWNGGTSQVRIHDGIDEELAQLTSVDPPPLSEGFTPAPIDLPDGFTATLVAGPPLVTHPTMGCFDDQGRMYVCNNSGVNMSNDDLETNLPNSIRRLTDSDADGRFDSFTVFADKMTFPMGGVFHDGSLYVASPPNIWRLTDTDDDGVADERTVIVSQFGYNGNAASIHGCFFGPDGRLYWTDGYHGHEFKDTVTGKVTSKREGSYIFSCLPDGTDRRIHCGGGMDNPVEIDFTKSGDMLGTVNILYHRPRVDCLVNWLHGGAYPHRERVLSELKVTGDLLKPVHRFGHVAISGMTRYRSGTMDHQWGDDIFATFFNSGKVVRLSVQPEQSSYSVAQHEFLSSPSREFHPTDVLEDADGSLLVIDTGGWFYKGCPTSQFAKPELLGGIYRIRRDAMTELVDPRGTRIDWASLDPSSLVKMLNDTRHSVRQQAINQCVARSDETLSVLKTMVVRGDIRIRENAVSALTRLAQDPKYAQAATLGLVEALKDTRPHIRQSACRGIAFTRLDDTSKLSKAITPLQQDDSPAVRRQAHTTRGMLGNVAAMPTLFKALGNDSMDRDEEHAAIYAMIEIGDVKALRTLLYMDVPRSDRQQRALLLALSQIDRAEMTYDETAKCLFDVNDQSLQRLALLVLAKHPEWTQRMIPQLRSKIEAATKQNDSAKLLSVLLDRPAVAKLSGQLLSQSSDATKQRVLEAIAQGNNPEPHPSWTKPLEAMLKGSDIAMARLAVAAAAANPTGPLRDQLVSISNDAQRPVNLRMDALSALHSGSVDTSVLNRLIQLYSDSNSPTATDRAAQIIGGAKLTAPQLNLVAPLMTKASPAQLRELIRPFQRRLKPQQAEAFLDSIESATSLLSLAESEVSDVVKRFPRELIDRGNKLLDRLKQDHQAKLLRLQRLRNRMDEGDSKRGEIAFASEKAKCSACHRVGKEGKSIGPDLTTIGANRSANDLLESIVFPSASIVRDYGTHQILTVNGKALTGVVVAEDVNALQLQQASGDRTTIPLDDIEMMKPSSVSIMPAGLDGVLTESELIDVVSYLQSLK